MFDILAEATQPAAESSWALVFLQLIDLVKTLAPLWYVIGGSLLGYFLGIRREITLRARARKEELPGRVLGALEECFQLYHGDLKAEVMYRYWSLWAASPNPTVEITVKEAHRRAWVFLDLRMHYAPRIAKSFNEVITSLAQLKSLYWRNGAIGAKLEEAIQIMSGFGAGKFKVGRPSDGASLEQWRESKQQDASVFLSKKLKAPVRAAVQATINQPLRDKLRKRICKRLHCLWRKAR